MIFWMVFAIMISTVYVLVFFYLGARWKYFQDKQTPARTFSFISVVVPFHGKRNLSLLLERMKEQDYPPENFELILVDDYSGNEMFPGVENHDFPFFRIRNKYQPGKKYALKTGIEAAKAEIIVTTDSDCLPGKSWLSEINRIIPENQEFFISMPVFMETKGDLFSGFQALEFSSLVASGAASFAAGNPVMCNGANLAFSRNLFLEGFNEIHPEIPSGDDMFLMLYAKSKSNVRMIPGKNRELVVQTPAERNLKSFIGQRRRWASKSLKYRDSSLVFLSLLILLQNLGFLSFVFAGFINPDYFIPALLVLFIKWITDFIFLRRFLSYYGKKELLKFFLPSQLVYSLYISFTAIIGFLDYFRTKTHAQ